MFNLDCAVADGRVQDQSFAVSFTSPSDGQIVANADPNRSDTSCFCYPDIPAAANANANEQIVANPDSDAHIGPDRNHPADTGRICISGRPGAIRAGVQHERGRIHW
jgi:hypothetical protein